MIFSYNWLQSFFKKTLPQPEKLADLLTMHSFEVEGIKKIKNDSAIDIDVTPNRGADCFSHIGIAREVSVLLKDELKIPIVSKNENKKKETRNLIKITVEDKKACPRYTAKLIKNVKASPSPNWLKERLEICGIRSINSIIDITNYIMLETGQPLHAFDYDKLLGQKPKRIIVRFAKKGEHITVLGDKDYKLDEKTLLIADQENPIAIAGIKGGKIPKIDKKTKNIVLESANFNPRIIRSTSRKINLRTDASWRFEHGVDPNLTEFAINRATDLIRQLFKESISQETIDVYPKKILPREVRLDLDYIKKLLGVAISLKEIKNILEKLDFKGLHLVNNSSLIVKIPTYRTDVSIPEDLVEEIGRIYGYKKISSVPLLNTMTVPRKNWNVFWQDTIKNILKELDFTEVYNYSFIGKEMTEGLKQKDLIEIENPPSSRFRYLRPSLLPNLLRNIKDNLKHFDDVQLFEMGKVFRKGKIRENNHLCAITTKSSFFQLKGISDFLLGKLGISNIQYNEYKSNKRDFNFLELGRRAEIKINHQKIGILGEISQQWLSSFGVNKKVFALNLELDKLFKQASAEKRYTPISPHPLATRDVSTLVPSKTKVIDVLDTINKAG